MLTLFITHQELHISDLSVGFNFLQQARVREVSTSMVGLIFGIYPFVAFVFAPICGLVVSSLIFFFLVSKLSRGYQKNNAVLRYYF